MKLRIFGNSIRLRLSQSELENLRLHGVVEDAVSFGNAALTYKLKTAEVPEPTAAFEQNLIAVYLPEPLARQWATTDEVSIRAEQPLPEGEKLKILIEKDFKCLTPRDEDESDNFPNPNSAC